MINHADNSKDKNMDEKKMSEELNMENVGDLPEIPEVFAAEYIKRMKADTPDLWDRIEAGIAEEPVKAEKTVPKKNGVLLHFKKYGGFYGMAAAAVLLIVIAMPVLSNVKRNSATANVDAPTSHQDRNDAASEVSNDKNSLNVFDNSSASYAEGECATASDSVEESCDDSYYYDSDFAGADNSEEDSDAESAASVVTYPESGSWEMTVSVSGMEYVHGSGEVLRIYGDDGTGNIVTLTNGLLSMTDEEILEYVSDDELENLKENIDSLQNGDMIDVIVYRSESDEDDEACIYIVGLR